MGENCVQLSLLQLVARLMLGQFGIAAGVLQIWYSCSLFFLILYAVTTFARANLFMNLRDFCSR